MSGWPSGSSGRGHELEFQQPPARARGHGGRRPVLCRAPARDDGGAAGAGVAAAGRAMTAFRNPSDAEIRALLERARVIAVVGLSPKPDRPSHGVARALQRFGYRVIPVRPAVASVLGEKAYPDLRAVPEKIDLVDVFRAPGH